MFLALLLSLGGSSGECPRASAAELAPATYCYKITITAVNVSSTTFTDIPVRFTWDAAAVIANGQLDPGAWEVLVTGSTASQPVGALAQTLTSSTSGWWAEFALLASGATRVNNLYFGELNQQRDQGILFAGTDTVTTPHHADFDVTNSLSLEVELELLDTTIATSTLASHWDANAGYKLEYGANALKATIASQTLSVPWDAAWTDEAIDIAVQFTSPNLSITVDDLPQGTLNTGLGTIPAVTTAFNVGTSLNHAYIRDVRVYGGSPYQPIAVYGFDASSMAELTSTNPFTGVIQDYDSSDHDLTYSFNRPWMLPASSGGAFTAAVSRVLPGHAAAPVVLPTSNPGQGAPFAPRNLFTPAATATDPLSGLLSPITTGNPVASSDFLWALMLGSLSLIIMAIAYALLPAPSGGGFNVVLAAVPGMLPVIWGMATNHLVWWWGLIWIAGLLILALGAGSLKRGQYG